MCQLANSSGCSDGIDDAIESSVSVAKCKDYSKMKWQILIGTVISLLSPKFSEFPYRDLYERKKVNNSLYFTK